MSDNNREFLKSLSDKQLAEEIKYGGARGSPHDRLHDRDLAEALAEQQRRSKQAPAPEDKA